MSVRAMQAGAVDFLPKPFRDQDLLDAIHKALQRDQALRHERAETAELRRRYDSLTPSETRLLPLVVAGRLNKQIAALMGISENTVKVHRSNMMQKMRANSVVELVRIADKLHIRAAAPDR
jgi:FixJ family two-component response regulator